MSKKIIKICIPILFLAGFLAIVVFSQKEIEEQKFPITPSDFSTYVDNYINDSIVNKDIREARQAYKKLYAIICTEDSLFSANPSAKLLEPYTAEDCYNKAFAAYFGIFKKDADDLFNKATWNNTHLNNLKSEAEELLQAYKGASQNEGELSTYISYVDGYSKAKNLIEYKSKKCTSKTGYDNLITEANKYTRYPYNNNTQLQGIVNTVKNNAKDAWWRYLDNKVNNLSSRCNMYTDYSDFYENYFKPLRDNIEDFSVTFNRHNDCGRLHNTINDTREKVRNCFNNNKKPQTSFNR